MELYSSFKRKFKKTVLVNIYQPDVWQIGFITNEDLARFDMLEYITVYVPSSYAVAGQLFFVKREKVKFLDNIASADAVKFAVSGGVVEFDDKENY